ncbi:MAG TPA: SMP-30/gluconolactonase/LRE family protein [Chitinophagaceae bacterium]|nr:SMP-30/gluconolactonase/LRE family protein [Chitinophagaceae bacterium]
MKKKLFLLLGVLSSLGFYSCQKGISNDSALVETESAGAANNGNRPGSESNFFDPAGLVSSSQHGILDTIQKGFSFTEGPAVDKQGNVFFTDQPNDKIYRWDAVTGEITLFLQGTGRSNGMAFDKDGNLIACADMHGELWKIFPDGSHEVLIDNHNDKLLNGPNDVWINPVTGGMYITDPMFPRGYWDANDPRKVNNPGWPPVWSDQGAGIAGHVYYLAPGSETLIRVTTMAGWNADIWPNGVVGTPDGKKLYVNNWTGGPTGNIWSFDINADGTLANMKTLVSGLRGSDGMSMDEQGNIYVSSGSGVNAYDPKGNKILSIPAPGGTNNVFAGKNNKLLFMTGPVDRVTSVKMNVKGVEKF